MGQSSSTQRDTLVVSRRRSRRIFNLGGERQGVDTGDRLPESQHPPPPTSAAESLLEPGSTPPRPFATFSRHISAQSIPVTRGRSGHNRDVSTRDDIFYEQHEQRPLAAAEELGIRSAPITHITASPMPRRSGLSRLGSIVRPQHVGNGPPNESHEARRTSRRRLDDSDGLSRRSSMFASLNFGQSTPLRSRPRREIAPISLPLPMTDDTMSLHSSLDSTSHSMVLPDLPTRPDLRTSGFFGTPLSARLARVRRSMTRQFDVAGPSVTNMELNDTPLRPSQTMSEDDADYLLPPMSLTDTALGLNAAVLGAADREFMPFEISAGPESPGRVVMQTDSNNGAERFTDRGPAGWRETRRVTNALRGRTSRLARHESEGPLPRILNLAASTIAAQLSGSPSEAVPSVQSLASGDLNGSLQNLFRAVQHASSMAENDQARATGPDNAQTEGTAPLNFLRVFRFVSQSAITSPTNEPPSDDVLGRSELAELQAGPTNNADEPEGRIVTLVVVGVRSVPSENARAENGRPEDMSASSPAIDSVYELPALTEDTNLLRSNAGGLLRPASIRTRLPYRRRASIGGLTSFPAQYDSQRHHRAYSSSRPSSGNATPTPGTTTPFFAESPPGPRPPPSTPADHALSAVSSQATTPSRPLSTISTLQYPPVFDQGSSGQFPLHEEGALPEEHPYRFVQQRRRSDSESARHRDLGAGAARRNGVVEPDDLETGDTTPSGTRSWLIYVVGTNVSEDHPALTTPSLFTDNPTYEDMLMLSSLLGPAKPPVASVEDIASAQGTYRLGKWLDGLHGIPIGDNGEKIEIKPGERCLVCLEEYQVTEEVRQLIQCSHLFHRECIDEVSSLCAF
ncbi:MAG: hypothetical protein Q9163_000126 [Psora crenata]